MDKITVIEGIRKNTLTIKQNFSRNYALLKDVAQRELQKEVKNKIMEVVYNEIKNSQYLILNNINVLIDCYQKAGFTDFNIYKSLMPLWLKEIWGNKTLELLINLKDSARSREILLEQLEGNNFLKN